MSELSTKAMQFAERMQNGPYVHLKDTRDFLTECAEQLDQKDALIAKLVRALEMVQGHIVNDHYSEAKAICYLAIANAREVDHVRKD